MRRATRFAIPVLLLLLAFALPYSACADSSLKVTSSVTPEALEKAGKVNISIKLENTSGNMLEDVTMIARGIDETLGNLEAGEKKSYNISNFKVVDEELGSVVTFTFVWYENGVQQSMTHEIPIALKSASPEMKAERTLSSNSGASGDVITINYAVQNTGDVDLTDVTITDPALTEPVNIGTIASGEVKRVSKTITLTQTVTSSPVVTANGGGTPLSVTIDPADITLTDAKLSVNVTAGDPSAEGTPVTIEVKNNGNVDFDSVALIDEAGTALTTAFPLAQTDVKTVTVNIPVEAARTLTVTATATYGEGTETPLIVTALPVELTPYLSPDEVVVTLIAKPIKTEFDEASEVTFAIRIDNDSPITLYDFELSEAEEGRLLTLDTVEQGAQTVNVKVVVSESRDVSFSAVFKDESGNSYTASATPVAITIASVSPSAEPGTDATGGVSWLKWVLLIIIVLLLAAAASLIYVLTQSRRRKEQEQEAEELDRMLDARQQRRHRESARAKETQDQDLEDALIGQITARTEKPRVPVRPRSEDTLIGKPPEHGAQKPTEPHEPPKPAKSKDHPDDLFDDEFK